MKVVGYLLLVGGFLLGAYATALHTQETDWMLFLPSALVAAVGVAALKRQASGKARSEEVLSANRIELTESLANVVTVLDELVASPSVAGDELRDAIDERLRDDIRRFADARESMIHLFGMQQYANIMSEFAAGERYVNRVWSASADGYQEEASRYLQRAATQFRHARDELAALAKMQSPA